VIFDLKQIGTPHPWAQSSTMTSDCKAELPVAMATTAFELSGCATMPHRRKPAGVAATLPNGCIDCP